MHLLQESGFRFFHTSATNTEYISQSKESGLGMPVQEWTVQQIAVLMDAEEIIMQQCSFT